VHWIYLAAAILFEIAGTVSMKWSNGFERILPSVMMAVFYILAFGSLTLSIKTIPVSTAYAIWSGTGTAAMAFIGFMFLQESLGPLKIAGILLVVAGVVLLNLNTQT